MGSIPASARVAEARPGAGRRLPPRLTRKAAAELGADAERDRGPRGALRLARGHPRPRLGAGIILTAHHADDQVETVLMRALEGSGAGRAGRDGVEAGHAWSGPLLPFRREALLRYVRARALPVWNDPANQDPRHLRVLAPARRPAAAPDAGCRESTQSLLAVGRHAARERAAWNAVLELLPGLDFRPERRRVFRCCPCAQRV